MKIREKKSSTLVRIGSRSHRVLRELARHSHRSMQQVLDEAIEAKRRQAFFQGIKDGYAELRADPKAWAEYQAELTAWDVTLMDGLDPNERWEETADGLAAPVLRSSRSKPARH